MPEKSETTAAAIHGLRRNRAPLAWVGNGFLIILALRRRTCSSAT